MEIDQRWSSVRKDLYDQALVVNSGSIALSSAEAELHAARGRSVKRTVRCRSGKTSAKAVA